jgi:GH3 auxin-responsive promoter
MRREAKRFVAATRDARRIQSQILRELLALNADSEFSRTHGLDQVNSAAEFRRRLPIADYDTFHPYIERVKQGETGALLGSKNRLLMFTLTSGTTSASKFIPITERFLADYRRGWKVWGIRAYDDHPALHQQVIVQLTSDHDQFRTPGGHPCGNISGLVSSMQMKIVKSLYTVPDVVAKIKSPEAKYYTALRLSLPDPRTGLVSTANPSTLIHLAKLADQHKEDLIRDVAEGTLSDKFDVSPEIRQALAPRLGGKNPLRASELVQIVASTGRLYPRDFWPDMSLLAVWTGGSAAAYVRGLKPYYGDVPVRDHGLSASEGRMTIPLADTRPDGILDITSHYFEFIPESQEGQSNPTVLEAHELRPGETYYILLTTASGLYRYNIKDVVRCTGFEGEAPLLEFLNKGAHIASLTGEKISESQVVAALRDATAELDLHVSFYTLAPVWGDPPGYRLLVEQDDFVSPEIMHRLAAAADKRLQTLNMEYGEKRQTGRLAPMAAQGLPAGTWARFARKRQSRLGGSVEQYKHPCLVPDLAFCESFLREFAQGP